jgi:hypothetical protein
MTAAVGYSGKPLAAKLGVKDGSRVLLVGAPAGFDLAAPAGAVVRSRPERGHPYDVVLAFCPDRAALRRRFAAQLPRLTTAGALWVAWPKRSSGVATDLDENVVRAHGLAVGLVDVKVAAVDATWSGLSSSAGWPTVSERTRPDVVVVGAGHNGLVAATMLARAGLSVQVLERADVIGGACRTEHPFAGRRAWRPRPGHTCWGLMPPELMATLDLDLPLVRRDPHYFLPTLDGRSLLLGGSRDAARRQFVEFFSEADAKADEALGAELAMLREDLAPAWLAPPLPLAGTADRYVRPELRETFLAMVRGSAMDYLDRFGFASETVLAMYAVTDGMPGLTGSPWSPGPATTCWCTTCAGCPGPAGPGWSSAAGWAR